jgi:hypothetical protein
VHDAYLSGHIVLYDCDRELRVKFDSKVIEQFIKEFGVLLYVERDILRKSFHFTAFVKTMASFDLPGERLTT